MNQSFLLWSTHVRYELLNATCQTLIVLFRWHHFNQVTAIFTNFSDNSVRKSYWKCFPFSAKTKLLVQNVKQKLRKFKLPVGKTDILLEHCNVLNVQTSLWALELISTLLLQKSIACPSQRRFTSVNFFTGFLLVFIPCDYIDRKYKTRKKRWISKLWRWHNGWDRWTIRG